MFCRSNQDGDQSAVYQMRRRMVAWWSNCGPLPLPLCRTVVEVRRVTCAPSVYYTAAQSNWYTPTYCIDEHWYLAVYSPLGFIEGWKLWWAHQKTTRAVKRRLNGSTTRDSAVPVLREIRSRRAARFAVSLPAWLMNQYGRPLG